MADTGFNILINNRSGTVLNMGQPAIESAIEASGIAVAELCFCEPDDMAQTLMRFAKSDAPLLIGGGDGTIREMAAALVGKKKAFGVLPFGTMNLMAKDLNLNSLQAALTAYAEGHDIQDVDAGFVNGELFLCCASIGTMPQASVFREENRTRYNFLLIPRLFLFVVDHLDKNKRQRIRLQIDGARLKFRAAAVVISNNRFAETTSWTESNFKRESLQGGELAIYASTTKSRWSHLRLLLRLMVGNWLKDPDMSEQVGKRMSLNTHRKKELVSIDGEVAELMTPLVFTIKPHHIQMLVPQPKAAEAV
ncbi:diacylglycerol/lipid kinase family protein [Asticcacaulis machinosus]|uniref:Diacylglycerol kinase family protein n=1 Tax=Asticcacaulis machinosus TaxID=2984211 RepID=A0ABT5HIP9_9CAUL|nr:diacylglycerol kinase family protein [Asticcacaulis machinosus]MDC7676083.1 diacylglycerol kinase family protein [Asticcacaulis machinosus]